MRKWTLPLLLAFCSPALFGQPANNDKNAPSAFRFFAFQSMKIDSKNKLMTFLQVTKMANDRLTVNDARSVVYDELTKEYFIYGCKDFRFAGNVVMANEAQRKNLLRYKPDDDVLYIE